MHCLCLLCTVLCATHAVAHSPPVVHSPLLLSPWVQTKLLTTPAKTWLRCSKTHHSTGWWILLAVCGGCPEQQTQHVFLYFYTHGEMHTSLLQGSFRNRFMYVLLSFNLLTVNLLTVDPPQQHNRRHRIAVHP